MPKFAANLHYLFTELPFLERFEAAAEAGFRAVEFQVPYDYPKKELAARLVSNGLKMVLFDAPMGDWDRGDRGLAAVPARPIKLGYCMPSRRCCRVAAPIPFPSSAAPPPER